MDIARTLACACGQAVLQLGSHADPRAYYWHVTVTGKAICPACMARQGRVIGAPRARTRGRTPARTPSSQSSIHTDNRSSNTLNGTYSQSGEMNDSSGLYESRPEGVGGVGDLSRRRDNPEVPAQLAEFDAILRHNPDYRPTSRFYAEIIRRFANVPGLSIEWEAGGMVDWLDRHMGTSKSRHDVPRFAVRWLTRALNDESQRRTGPARRNGNGKSNGVASQYNYGASSLPDDTLASIESMDRRGGSHYER